MQLNHIYQGDVLTILKQFDSESVDCVITSPPYWSLRDYNVDGQIGLENNFTEYIDKLISVFDEIKRILKSEGTLWINLGDTYMNNSSYSKRGRAGFAPKDGTIYKKGLPQKSLCMIPERFAIKMIDNGWILRNKIIWHKPNAMPQSAKDRFTVDWEYIFFFARQRKYYFKQILEPANYDGRKKKILEPSRKYGTRNYPNGSPQQMARKPMLRWPNTLNGEPARNKRAVWSIPTQPFKGGHFAIFPEKLVKPIIEAGCPENGIVLDPFCGSGTTLIVAKKMRRQYVGIDLKPEYVKMAEQRLNNTSYGLF